MGEPITWVVPHAFTQSVPKEVDFRVMLTFLEFYEVFMRFVLFKLYHLQNIAYPPVVDPVLEAEGCCLLAIHDTATDIPAPTSAPVTKSKKNKVDEKLQAKVTEAIEEFGDDEEEEELGESLTGPLASAFNSMVPAGQEGDLERNTFSSSMDEATRAARLFEGLVFFLNREIPRACLQVCILSFGGLVGWQGAGSPIDINDTRITHHIVDRPMQAQPGKSREYIQPQWVFDSLNAQLRLPTRGYAPGATLPPHLSPFVDDEKEGYVPQYREEIRRMQGKPPVDKAAEKKPEASDEEEEEGEMDVSEEEEGDESGEEEEESEEEPEEVPQTKKPAQETKKGPKAIVFQAKQPKVTEVSCMPCCLLLARGTGHGLLRKDAVERDYPFVLKGITDQHVCCLVGAPRGAVRWATNKYVCGC